MPHLERQSKILPLPCFGLELSLTDPKCQQCPHLFSCDQTSGSRKNNVYVDKAEFNLINTENVTTLVGDPDITSIYTLAYLRVFDHSTKEHVPKHICQAILLATRKLRITTETYIYSCLLGHKISCPERHFRPSSLIGPSAEKKVSFYCKQSVERFGTIDVSIINSIGSTGSPDNLRELMRSSEELFGAWIIGARIKHGGNGVASLFINRELALSHYWLAIEPTYLKWVVEQPTRPASAIVEKNGVLTRLPDEKHRHREAVSLIPISVRNSLLQIRSEIMPTAILRVLQHQGLRSRDLQIASPVSNAFKLWLSIGDALLQLRLINVLS